MGGFSPGGYYTNGPRLSPRSGKPSVVPPHQHLFIALRRQQIFHADREFADTNTRGMMHGVGDSRSDAGETDLSDSTGAKRVQHLVRIVKESDVDFRSVRIRSNNVVGKVVIDGHSETGIIDSFLKEGHANPHNHRTLNLVASRLGVNDVASVNHRNHARDAQTSRLRLPGHLCKLRAKRVGGVRALWIPESALRLSVPGSGTNVSFVEYLLIPHTTLRSLALQVNTAIRKIQRFRLLPGECRVLTLDSDREESLLRLFDGFENRRDDRSGSPGASGNRTRRKIRISQNNLDVVVGNPGFIRNNLRQDSVSTGADILRSAGDACSAII